MTEKNKLLAVIRVRGRVKVRQSISETLDRLRLRHVNNLVLLKGDDSYLGMVQKCKDFVTFGEIDKDVLGKLLTSKGLSAGSDAVDSLASGSKTVKDLKLEMPLKMHPPKRGYEGIKKDYRSGGALGYRGAEINKLIERML